MAHEENLKSKRSGALDLFRFLAVLVVFLAHYTDTFNFIYNIVPANLKWSPVSRYGSCALLIFFMISGYVVTMTSVKRNLKDFLTARLSRIYPLFWVSCIIAFALPRLIHDHTYLTYSTVKQLLFNMTMMPQVFRYEMINPVYYTLLIELVFYFFIAFIILFKLWDKILIVLSVILAYCLAYSQDITASLHIFIPPFLAGMLFYFIKIKYKTVWKLYALLAVNYFCTLTSGRFLVLTLGQYYKNPDALNVWTMTIIITCIYGLLYLITIARPVIKDSKFTRVLGEIAYPFYLFHVYFLFWYWYFSKTVQPDVLLLAILAVVLLVSWGVNVWVEKPLSKLTSHILYLITGLFGKSKNEKEYLPRNEPPPL